MRTWQLIGSSGITLGTVDAVTATEAIRQWRDQKEQTDSYFDQLYVVFQVIGNKILFERWGGS